MVDEHLNWKDFINILGNKLQKKFLKKKAMTSLYYSFFHSYLTCGNIAWCTTTVSKLKKLYIK